MECIVKRGWFGLVFGLVLLELAVPAPAATATAAPNTAQAPAAVGPGAPAMAGSMPGMAGMDQQEHPNSASSTEFELFPSFELLSGLNAVPPLDRDDDAIGRVDIVFGHISHGVHVFGEYLVTTFGEHDMERLQAGYELDPDTMIWIGRYHQPASAWNTEHHHGQYLQTSIERPGIARWEDEDGIIPQHITGALIESHRQLGDTHGLQLAAGVGAAPAISLGGFDPIDVDRSNDGSHRFAANARIGFLPDYLGTDLVALLWAHNEFAMHDPRVQQLLVASTARMDLVGAQFDWTPGPWHLLGAGYDVHLYYGGLGTAAAGPRTEHFASGYLQIERTLRRNWTVYARVEPSSGTQNSRLVSMIAARDEWAYERELAGVRWDFMRRQALTAEYSYSAAAAGHFPELRVQWSAALP